MSGTFLSVVEAVECPTCAIPRFLSSERVMVVVEVVEVVEVVAVVKVAEVAEVTLASVFF